MTAAPDRLLGWTVGSASGALVLPCSWRPGDTPTWIHADAEAIRGFLPKKSPPWGPGLQAWPLTS